MQERVHVKKIKKTMKKAGIPVASVASFRGDEPITSRVIDPTENDSNTKVTPETVFGAASLSKPVFAYLVLKLINDNKTGKAKGKIGEFKLPPEEKEFNLDTKLYKIFPDILKKFRKEDEDNAQQLTARMVLSHTTGLPIVHNSKDKPIEFQFEPGAHYGYSGPGIACLQEAIKALTGKDLESLAQEHIFRKGALDMPNSSFHHDKSKPQQAANSLYTTPSDYAKFIRAWINDPALQDAFLPKGLPIDKSKPVFSMKEAFLPKDWAIKDAAVSDADREHVSWGLGFGLQIDDKGDAVSAYHSGDMNEYRAWVAINLKDKSAIVYFTNSHNGHILADQIIPPNIKLDHVFNFFFQTYGFARNLHELAKTKGVESDHGLRRGCLELELNDREMANSDFGRGSNTAKMLAERQTTKGPTEEPPKKINPVSSTVMYAKKLNMSLVGHKKSDDKKDSEIAHESKKEKPVTQQQPSSNVPESRTLNEETEKPTHNDVSKLSRTPTLKPPGFDK